jgi:hypothetical protein
MYTSKLGLFAYSGFFFLQALEASALREARLPNSCLRSAPELLIIPRVRPSFWRARMKSPA